jgi:hypothetical protein
MVDATFDGDIATGGIDGLGSNYWRVDAVDRWRRWRWRV